MNAVDIAILIVVGIFAVGGLRRGFLLGLVDLIAFALALVVAARLAAPVAEPLARWGFPVEFAAAAGFVIVAVVSLAVIGLAARVLLAPLGALASSSPLGWANGVLGLLPGAIRGLAVSALLVMLLSALPAEFGLREPLAASRLAEPIERNGRYALDLGLAWAGVDVQSLAAPSPYLPLASGTIELPFSGVTALETDYQAEQSLLDMINQERASAGLSPLQPDNALAEVGRQHGRDMLALGFLSHTSPTTGSPADRLALAGLNYPLAGENIALAPTIVLAHEGLMNSPTHRANILNPSFTKVGVAVLRSAEHGLMVIQEFAAA